MHSNNLRGKLNMIRQIVTKKRKRVDFKREMVRIFRR